VGPFLDRETKYCHFGHFRAHKVPKCSNIAQAFGGRFKLLKAIFRDFSRFVNILLIFVDFLLCKRFFERVSGDTTFWG
jgi:hypothetical protein